MSELLAALSFSIVPMLAALVFALVVPCVGTVLALRNEMLLGIALPPVASAAMAAALLAGLPPQSPLLLYAVAAIVLFAVMAWLPSDTEGGSSTARRRELVLAALFCIGSTLTVLFMALSPSAEGHFRHMLQGEVLAVSLLELAIAAALALALLTAAVRMRGVLFAFSLDEEGLRIRQKSYRTIAVVYRLGTVLVVTGGVVLVGPLLTTALLVLPAFFTERASRGLSRFVGAAVLVGFCGTLAGFVVAIALDLPPAPMSVCGIVGFGLLATLSAPR